jgi:hypothetical protein
MGFRALHHCGLTHVLTIYTLWVPIDLPVGEAKKNGTLIFVGIIHDLIERKLTEQQLQPSQKMEMVGQLSGGIAHRLFPQRRRAR